MFPPGKYGHPITGNLQDLKTRVLDFFCEQQETYGDVSTIRFSVRKVLYIQHPDLIQYVLQENNKNYTKSLRYEQLKYLLGNGLLTSEGEFWLRQRRLIQPAFHKQKLAQLVTDMATCTGNMIFKWEQGSYSQLTSEMMMLTLDIVSSTLLHANVKNNAAIISEALSFLLKSVNIRTRTPILLPIWIPIPEHQKIKKAVKAINEVLDAVFEQRRSDSNQHHDLLSMLMESKYEDTGESMSNKQLRDEVMTIFVAGHETTANALSWALFLLAKHPEKLSKCKNEVRQVLNGRTPEFNDLTNLKYLTNVIEETLRIYPPAWIIGRKNIKPDTIGNYAIPAGTNVLISPYALHRDKRFWENPEAFIPERFETGETVRKVKNMYLPFGAGPRICIGNNFAMMEMQIVLAMILAKFTPVLNSASQVVPEPLITLRPKGLEITMKPDFVN
jgi:cytochrome P450